MTGSATKSQRTPGKALRLFFVITALVCWALYSNQCVEYGIVPAFFGQFPHHFPVLVCLRASGDWEDVSYHKERDLRALLWLFFICPDKYDNLFLFFKAFGCLESSHSEKTGFSVFQRERVVFFGFLFLSFETVSTHCFVALEAWNLLCLKVRG